MDLIQFFAFLLIWQRRSSDQKHSQNHIPWALKGCAIRK